MRPLPRPPPPPPFITHLCSSDTLLCGVSVRLPRRRATAFTSLYDELMISPETPPSPGFLMALRLCLSRSGALVNCKVKSPKPPPVSSCLMPPLFLYSFFYSSLQVRGKMTTQSLNCLYRISRPTCMAPLLQALRSLRIDRGQD